MNSMETRKNLREIVKYAKEVGPRNAALLSRHTDIPSSTVRYSIQRLLERGTRFRANVAYHGLGLKRHLLFLEFDEGNVTPEDILQLMAKEAFLEWYGKTVPTGSYYALAAVPDELQRDHEELLDNLVESGVLQSYSSRDMDWIRLRSLDEEDYDFKNAQWHIDWSSLHDRTVQIPEPPSPTETSFTPDKTDLMILKEIQLDATRRLSEIARRLDITYRTVYYHYTEHILGEGLLNRFTVYVRPTAGEGQGTSIIHLIHDLEKEELALAENLFHRLPFTWMDGYSQRHNLYMVYTTLPHRETTNMLKYLSEEAPMLRGRYTFHHLDLDHAKYFTVPYELMTEEGEWEFEPQKVARQIVAQSQVRQVPLEK